MFDNKNENIFEDFDFKYLLYGMAGMIAIVTCLSLMLNVNAMTKISKMEKNIASQKETMQGNIAEEVTKVFEETFYSSNTEMGTIMNTEEVISDEEIQQIIDKVTLICEEKVTDNVYKGVAKIVITDIQDDIRTVVNEELSVFTITKEQINTISSSVEEIVVRNINETMEKMENMVKSNNSLVAALESRFTVLSSRFDTLESSIESNKKAWESADTELKDDINQLRLSMVTGNSDSKSLEVLSTQITSLNIILSDTKSTIEKEISCTEEERANYLKTVESYKKQVASLKTEIDNAIKGGSDTADDALYESASKLTLAIAQFSASVDELKTSPAELKKLIADNTALIADRTAELSEIKKQQSDLTSKQKALESEQAALKEAETAINSALENKITLEEAIARIEEKTGDLGDSTVLDTLNGIVTDLKAADDTNKTEILESANQTLNTNLTAVNANISKVEEELASVNEKYDEVNTGLTSLRSDLTAGLASVNEAIADNTEEIEKNKEELAEAESKITSLEAAKIALENADKDIQASIEDQSITTTKKINNTISTINNLIGTLPEGSDSVIEALTAQKTALETSLLESEEAQNTALSQAQAAIENQITGVSGDITSLTGTVNELTQKNTELSNSITTVSEKTTENEAAIDANKTAIDTNKSSINELNTKVGDVESSIESTKNELTTKTAKKIDGSVEKSGTSTKITLGSGENTVTITVTP